MAKQTSQNLPDTDVSPADDLASAKVALPTEQISSAKKILEATRSLVEPHRGPEADESLELLSTTSHSVNMRAGVKDNQVHVTEAFINNQNPLRVNLTLPGMLLAQEANAREIVGAVEDLARSGIQERLAAAGLPQYGSPVLVGHWKTDLELAPPLPRELEQGLEKVAGLVRDRIAEDLAAKNLSSESSAVQRMAPQKLVFRREGTPEFSTAA